MLELILVGFLILLIVVAVSKGRKFTPPETKPSSDATHRSFELAPSLFVNRSELAFFHALSRAVPSGYCVQSKVRLEDIVRVKKDIKDTKIIWALRNRVKSRHLDFLIINDQGCALAAIELDGKVHRRKETNNADALKDGIFAACGLPLIRVMTGENFNVRAREIVMGIQI